MERKFLGKQNSSEELRSEHILSEYNLGLLAVDENHLAKSWNILLLHVNSDRIFSVLRYRVEGFARSETEILYLDIALRKSRGLSLGFSSFYQSTFLEDFVYLGEWLTTRYTLQIFKIIAVRGED